MQEMRRLISTLQLRVLLAAVAFSILSLPVAGQRLIGTVPVGQDPYSIAVNSTTHKVYVANKYSNTVTVIDESNLSTVTVPVPGGPVYLAVDELRNKIYVTGFVSMAVIDGATNTVTTINAGPDGPVAVNPVTNKIYAVDAGNTVTVVDGVTLSALTVTVGTYPLAVAINSATNKIYVSIADGSVTVIDGASNSTSTVSVPGYPEWIVVNTNTNKAFASSYKGVESFVTVIDGATLSTTVIDLGQFWGTAPPAVGVDQLTNKIYAAGSHDQYTSYVDVIDGATLTISTIAMGARNPVNLAVEPLANKVYVTFDDVGVGNGLAVVDGGTNYLSTVFSGYSATVLAVDSTTNRIYIANLYQQFVWVVAGFSASQFVAVPPCRLADTRPSHGGNGPIMGGTSQSFPVPQLGGCNIPATAGAYSLNVTMIPHEIVGALSVYPTGAAPPAFSTTNSWDGRVKANAAIVPAGSYGAVSVYSSGTTDVALDIDGYFGPVSDSTLAFYPLAPCRVADTRWAPGDLGGPYLHGGQERDLPVLESQCGIPSTAKAYSFNFTAIPRTGALWVFSAWPAGQPNPGTSILNAPTGTVVANAAILPAGTGGDIDVVASSDTDLAIDVNGYFAPAGAGGLSLYTAPPCRVLDTRKVGDGSPFNGLLSPPVKVAGYACGVSSAAQAIVFNATIVPAASPVYLLALWPDGDQRPNASVLNAWDGDVTSNMAIIPTMNGSIDAYSAGLTQLILDISGYFAP